MANMSGSAAARRASADVRIVAAANVDLPAMAADGKFRADLLDRLAFDVIATPPLRARREDIPLLAAHFASGLAREMGVRFEGFSADAAAMFLAHDWPGNVRELKNAAERSLYRWIAASRSGPVDEVCIDPFGSDHRAPAPVAREESRIPAPARASQFDLRRELNSVEKRWVADAIAAAGGNQKEAAARLALTYDQIRGLVRKHGLQPANRPA